MDTNNRAGTPLRQRMLDDMRMRKLEPKTQEAYVRAVRKLAAYLGRSPDTATVEDLRNFQLHLVDTGISPITLNATLTGLKFFFDITLGQIELMARMQPVKVPRTLPVVLSTQEVTRLIAAARNVKEKEVRAWTIHIGDTAPQAAGVIHTDFERGFIRAQTIAYNDYITHQGEQGAKDAGKMRSEGKEYVVKDGDVMNFLFNV